MTHPYFFGYGSLVNVATHAYQDPRPAQLNGWRRAWRHTDLRPVAFLTAIPAPDHQIDGIVARVPDADWVALDEREWAYDRIGVSHRVSHDLTATPEISVYAVPQARQNNGSERHPVMLSYLDVVVQGYLDLFGETGVDRFFDTTDGWDAPFVNDRAAPRYPRHQTLTSIQRDLVDHHLHRLSVRILTQT